MRPVAQGRPGTEVIPAGWSADHRPVVKGTFTATVAIRHPGGTQGAFDPETGTYPNTPHPAHYGAGATEPNARIQVQPIFSGERDTAGQLVSVAGYLVVVDRDTSTATAVGDICKVTAVDDNGDPSLVNRELTVSGVARGSLAWERDLTCLDDLG